MDINVKVKSNLKIRAFYLFFIITSIQTGTGIMGAPRYIYLEAGRDAWLSIIIALAYMLFVVMSMYFILKQYESADILGIQVDVFGIWIGKILGTIFLLHLLVSLLTILSTYIEVVQIFLFPTFPTWVLAILFLSLIIYSVLGGIRIVVGVAFTFFIFTELIMFLLITPALRIEITHFLPAFQTPIVELLKGAKATSFSFLGFEILLLLYPFIQNKQSIKWPISLGVTRSALALLVVTIVAIGYYSPRQLESLEWSVLGLFKIISFSFLERFDYIVITVWMMVILPNMILLMWGITYGMKRLYKIQQKKTLYITAILLFITSSFLEKTRAIIELTSLFANLGFWLIYVYPFALLPIVLIKKKWRKQKGEIKS